MAKNEKIVYELEVKLKCKGLKEIEKCTKESAESLKSVNTETSRFSKLQGKIGKASKKVVWCKVRN